MTEQTTMPDWVLIEAAKRSGWVNLNISWTPDRLRAEYPNDGAYRALCDLILETQQPPVDRKVLCAREAGYLHGYIGGDLAEKVGVSSIELWEQGFGQ